MPLDRTPGGGIAHIAVAFVVAYLISAALSEPIIVGSGFRATLPVSINAHGFIAETTQQALDIAYPSFEQTMNKIGRERGWAPLTRQQFEAEATLRGAKVIGSPDDVIEKVLFQHELFGHQRFLLQLSVGTLPHEQVLQAIELLGTVVAPAVRKEVAQRTSITVV